MTAHPRRILSRMTPRNPQEPHRTASPLELFFDLVFVVAVSLSSQELHHIEADGHLITGAVSYLMVFFAIWWAWMNFTWFATSFDTDDWLYRIMTVIQMAGALTLAAGSTRAMESHDFTLVTFGYVVMRLAMVTQWIRAGVTNPEFQATAFHYAAAITVVQVAWVARLALPPEAGMIGFFVLALAEVAVPVWSERHGSTPWNAHHIAERYSLFTLILLGESILASTNAVLEAIDLGEHLPDLLTISAAGLIIAAGMWWIYFSREQHHHITTLRSSLVFGYFHYFIFAAAGAFSAGIEVAIGSISGQDHLGHFASALTLTMPIAVFVLGIWWLTLRHTLTPFASALAITGTLVVIIGSLMPGTTPVVTAALGVIVTVVATELPHRRSHIAF